MVSLLGIVEDFSSTYEVPSLDFLINEIEWMVLKRKIRGGNRADVGSTMRIGRPLIMKICKKENKNGYCT